MIAVRLKTEALSSSLCIATQLTFGEFCDRINEVLNLAYEFDILIGFPPKLVEESRYEEQIGDSIKNNEIVRIQKKNYSGMQAQGIGKMKVSRKKSSLRETAGNVKSQPKITSNIHSLRKCIRRRRGHVASATDKPQIDIGEQLVNALSGERTNVGRELRSAFRNAMEANANNALALARVNSACSGKYTIEDVNGSGSLLLSKMNVEFHKGLGTRRASVYSEEVDVISADLIKSVLSAALADSSDSDHEHARELLRPINLSRTSPRIFWSIVRWYGSDIRAGLKTMFPAVTDWDWLDERKRTLSEKALENQRQQQELEVSQSKRKKLSRQATVEALTAVSTSAAASAPAAAADKDSTVAPAVNASSSGSASSSSSTINSTKCEFLTWLTSLPLETAGLVPQQHCAALAQAVSSHQLFQLANADANKKLLSKVNVEKLARSELLVTMDQLDLFVASAQQHLVDLFWHWLCGGSERLRRALLQLRITSPRSLWVWRNMPEELQSALVETDSAVSGLALASAQRPLRLNNCSNSIAIGIDWVRRVMNSFEQADEVMPWLRQHDNDDSDQPAVSELYCGESMQLCGDGAHEHNGDINSASKWVDWVMDHHRRGLESDGWVVVQAHNSCSAETVRYDSALVSSLAHLGKAVRVSLDEASEDAEAEVEAGAAGASGSYWLEGVVVACQPPTKDDPTPLWKVLLNPLKPSHSPEKISSSTSSSSSSSSTSMSLTNEVFVWFEDLEDSEICEIF